MKRSAIYICELQLHFARSDAVNITFCQVLFARTSSLNHLVDGSVARFEELMSKEERHIVDALRLLECLQSAIVVVLPKEVLVLVHLIQE